MYWRTVENLAWINGQGKSENVLVKLTSEGKEGCKLAESLGQDIPVKKNNVAQPAKVEKSLFTTY